MASAAMLARKYALPVIPLHITARNSALFYLFDRIHPTLRDITLFHEVLNKRHQPYRITLGAPIDPATLPSGTAEATEVLRARTLELGGEKPQTVLTAPRYAPRPPAARPDHGLTLRRATVATAASGARLRGRPGGNYTGIRAQHGGPGNADGRRVLLIVGGGIAAYKSLELIRLIRQAGGAGDAGADRRRRPSSSRRCRRRRWPGPRPTARCST